MQVPENERLPTLHSVVIPPNIDDLRIRNGLMDRFGLEIGGGLGPLKGRIWRIGLMGASSTQSNVLLCLSALSMVLRSEGFVQKDDPISAMNSIYDNKENGVGC